MLAVFLSSLVYIHPGSSDVTSAVHREKRKRRNKKGENNGGKHAHSEWLSQEVDCGGSIFADSYAPGDQLSLICYVLCPRILYRYCYLLMSLPNLR